MVYAWAKTPLSLLEKVGLQHNCNHYIQIARGKMMVFTIMLIIFLMKMISIMIFTGLPRPAPAGQLDDESKHGVPFFSRFSFCMYNDFDGHVYFAFGISE